VTRALTRRLPTTGPFPGVIRSQFFVTLLVSMVVSV
jgi:hypothetical protein